MATLNILEFPDPRLRAKAEPVSVFDDALAKLADDMLETMYAASGIGLAATQVGITQRIFVMDISENASDPQVLINPRISDKRGEQVYQEGCLSFPGIFADVKRADWIHVEAEDVHGNTVTREVDGLNAVCIQHELDHLDGKVFVDYLSPLKRSMLLKRLEKQRRKAG
ncbi:MAG TPA: peptide deformylase [Rhodanobacteraceae bacterium]|nr:peptide deformylase [Rhodanobacteraceae bacterium]